MNLWVRSGRRGLQRSSLIGVAFLVALSLALGACGGEEELKRQDYSTAIAPERCGGSGGGPC